MGCSSPPARSAVRNSPVSWLAHHDPLTDLLNRLLFLDRLNQALSHAKRGQSQLALLFTRARMGGDEFILMLENLRSEQDAAHLADKLLQVLAQPYRIRGHELYVTASIGISL